MNGTPARISALLYKSIIHTNSVNARTRASIPSMRWSYVKKAVCGTFLRPPEFSYCALRLLPRVPTIRILTKEKFGSALVAWCVGWYLLYVLMLHRAASFPYRSLDRIYIFTAKIVCRITARPRNRVLYNNSDQGKYSLVTNNAHQRSRTRQNRHGEGLSDR